MDWREQCQGRSNYGPGVPLIQMGHSEIGSTIQPITCLRTSGFRFSTAQPNGMSSLVRPLASLRPSFATLVGLERIDDEEPLDSTVLGSTDPADIRHGLVRADWRLGKVVGHTILEPHLRFVDLSTAQTSQHLRRALVRQAVEHGATDIDQSLLMESRRGFTRQVARYIYERKDEGGTPRFARIRHISRFDSNWECWAIFADRMKHVSGMASLPQTIHPDDEDLLHVAALFNMAIETVEGHGQFYRP